MKLQKNKIYNYDWKKIINLIPDKSIDLVITDPPYDIENSKNKIQKIQKINENYNEKFLKRFNHYKEMNDIIWSYDIVQFGDIILNKMMKPNLYFFCNKKQIPDYLDYYVKQKKLKFNMIIWHKRNAQPTYYNKYLDDCEYILHFHSGGKVKPENYIDAQTVIFDKINHNDKKKYHHPTIKPLFIIEKLIKNSSKIDELVFDPFSGSGTTAVGCKKLNRNFICCEINKKHFNNSINRLNENCTIVD